MKDLPDKSVDLIMCDLPYGMTACKWDTVIPLDLLWAQYKRIIKPGRAIILTGCQPFTSALVMSNPKWFKCEWIYDKIIESGFQNARFRPMVSHENVLIFGEKRVFYNPIFQDRHGKSKTKKPTISYNSTQESSKITSVLSGSGLVALKDRGKVRSTKRVPRSIQAFGTPHNDRGLHPTQKPIGLYEYFIKTYSNEGDLVLDNCAGSGTCGVACVNTNRNFILMEKDPKYCKIIRERLQIE